jgi:ABC-type branched-subunit amino acid transport system substrate-binding protein
MPTKQPMSRLRTLLAVVAVLGLVAAACGNSGDSKAGNSAAPPTSTSSGGGAVGVPGVTADTISYSAIGTQTNNPLGTCILKCYTDGVKAYFDYRNDQGGIYGRKLVLSKELDDELGQNQVRALEVTTANDTFGTFNAASLASGWETLANAGMPTYVWAIQAAQMSGHPQIFGQREVVCISCTSRGVAYVAQQAGAKHVATLGYGISDASKECSHSQADSIKKYSSNIGGTDVVYTNDDLAFGLPNGIGPEVTAMKNAGVDLITACLDLNGMKTLAQELKRQGMQDVTLYHTNTYDQDFVSQAGDLFEGDYMGVAFRPFEAASGSSSLDAYKEWMGKSGKALTEPAMVGWINADLAYQGLKDAGPDFNRQKVIDATNKLTDYTAGGLTQPVDWSRQHTAATEEDPATHGPAQDCIAVVKVKGGKFELVGDSSKPWACWPGNTRDWSDPTFMNFE